MAALRYSGMAIQFGVMIAIAAWGGQWLDEYFNTPKPFITIFLILFFTYWRSKKRDQPGFLFGLFLVLLMSVRVFVEQFKVAQVDGREDWIMGLNTGQALSIPFILIGLYFIFFYRPKTR